jgi:hypothetical protein
VDTTTATTEVTDPVPCGLLSNAKSVWYRYTPSQSGFINAHTFGSNYDTILAAYVGTPGSFVEIACNDDEDDFDLQSFISIPVVAGTTYSFMITAYRGNGGSTVFHLTKPYDSLTHLRGDYNGDSRSDITWEHTDASSAVWLMNGTAPGAAGVLLGPSTGWSVRALADFDGNGTSDILWQHTDGRVSGWLMNGLSLSLGGSLLGPGQPWTVRTIGDFNGDGKADILWEHLGGATNIWLMDGLNLVSGGQVLPGGTGWTV